MELERGDARLRKVAILVILLTVAVGAGALLGLQYWLETLRLRPAPQARQSLAAALLWSTATICVCSGNVRILRSFSSMLAGGWPTLT